MAQVYLVVSVSSLFCWFPARLGRTVMALLLRFDSFIRFQTWNEYNGFALNFVDV